MSDATDYDALTAKLAAAGLAMPNGGAPAPPAPAAPPPPALAGLTQQLGAAGFRMPPQAAPGPAPQPMIGPPPPPPAQRAPATAAEINASDASVSRAADAGRLAEMSRHGMPSRPTPLQIDAKNAGRDINVDLSGMREPGKQTAVGRADADYAEAVFAPPPVKPTIIPAHEAALVSPERQKAIQAADQGIIDATSEQERAGMHEVEAKTVGLAQKRQLLEEQGKEIKERSEIRAAAEQREIDKLNQLSAEAAAGKIDPERWYKERSTGEKIGYSIAAALGGFVAGFKGGPNSALDSIYRHVDNDIAAQKEELQRKRDRIADQRGILAETFRRFGNMEQAESAARILSLQQVEAQIEEYGAGVQSEKVQANGALAKAQLRKTMEEEGARMNKYVGPTVAGGNGILDEPLTREEKVKIREASTEVNAGIQQLQAIDPSKIAAGGRLGHKANEIFGGTANTRRQEADRDAYNSMVRQLAGAAWRLQTHGMEPKNEAIIAEQAAPFLVTPADDEQAVREKAARLQRHLASSGKSSNAIITTPPTGAGPAIKKTPIE